MLSGMMILRALDDPTYLILSHPNSCQTQGAKCSRVDAGGIWRLRAICDEIANICLNEKRDHDLPTPSRVVLVGEESMAWRR